MAAQEAAGGARVGICFLVFALHTCIVSRGEDVMLGSGVLDEEKKKVVVRRLVDRGGRLGKKGKKVFFFVVSTNKRMWGDGVQGRRLGRGGDLERGVCRRRRGMSHASRRVFFFWGAPPSHTPCPPAFCLAPPPASHPRQNRAPTCTREEGGGRCATLTPRTRFDSATRRTLPPQKLTRAPASSTSTAAARGLG